MHPKARQRGRGRRIVFNYSHTRKVLASLAIWQGLSYTCHDMQAFRRLIPVLVVWLMRALAVTLRWCVEDRCGVTRGDCKKPVIGVFWHNRLLVVPILYGRFCLERRGHCLTSPSGDGEIIAGVMDRFDIGSVRGSSSRRGFLAMREMAKVLKSGEDIAITPDGPRGPKYGLNPGIAKLAQITDTPVMPIHIGYSSYWEIKSWDAFRIPKPFAQVKIVFGPLYTVCPTKGADAFEAERVRLETLLREGTEAVDQSFSSKNQSHS